MHVPKLPIRIGAIVAITVFLTWMFRHNQVDDSLIYARYVRNALEGYGLVFNPGEHVNALTSPLYSALTLLVSWITLGHVLLAENLLWVIFFATAACLAEKLTPWSGLLIASTAFFYYCIGMETGLFLFLLILLATLYVEKQDTWIPLVALLLLLVRLEGGALVAVVVLQMLRERRFPALRSFVLPAVVVGIYLIFNLKYYGALMPSSGLAKLAQARSGYWGRWPTAFLRVPPQLYYSFKLSVYLIPLALVLVPMGIRKLWGTPLNKVLLPSGMILLGFYVLYNIPDYHWYYAPFVFFAIVYSFLGAPQIKAVSAIAAIIVLQCFVVSVYKGSRSPVDYPYKQLGIWLDQNTAQNARVAVVETGAVGWYSHRYIDDLIGLTTPVNAVYLEHHDMVSWLNEQRPDYVVMHEQPSFGEVAAAASPEYEYLPIRFGSLSIMRRRQGLP